MNRDWKTERFFRMWPRAVFHVRDRKNVHEKSPSQPGVYVLYGDDESSYIGKTGKRLEAHALKPNSRRHNF
jgi:hypothetical protein